MNKYGTYKENFGIAKVFKELRFMGNEDLMFNILDMQKKHIQNHFNTSNRDECVTSWLQLYTDFMQSDDFKERDKKKLSVVTLTQQYELHMMARVKRGQIKQSSAEASMKMMKRITKWIKNTKDREKQIAKKMEGLRFEDVVLKGDRKT